MSNTPIPPITLVLDDDGRPLKAGQLVDTPNRLKGIVKALFEPDALDNPLLARRWAAVTLEMEDGRLQVFPSHTVHRVDLVKSAEL